jgi:regulator of protease activity HflC (stomatin/prohibitin superfamily)
MVVDISTRLFPRHLRADPTVHVRHHRRGKLVHDGPAAAFWYRPGTAALAAVPVDDREQPLLFHGRSSDFQDVTVQATVTYRLADPGRAAARIDFGIDPWRGAWRATPLEQLGGLLTELAQQYALDLLAGMTLREALAQGMTAVRERVASGLTGDSRLAEIGIEVVAVRVVAVRAEADLESALRTPAREQVQQEADRATFERRAVAVERERAIAENELQNQIELARREQQLVEQRGRNDLVRAQEQAEADRIDAGTQAERARITAQAKADAVRLVGFAEAETHRARLAIYQDLPPVTVLGLAATELAGHMPAIGSLTITPDLLSGALTRLVAAGGDQP